MTSGYKFGTLQKEAESRLRTDNDIKIIIQGTNSQTGIGKTTLAIKLARAIDESWGAESKAFVDIREYIDAHLNEDKGSALLLDEIEKGADSRRAMSQDNVDLSQAWATMRARNMATICTLPSISMLDGRMLELADYWVLVRSRGVAQPYKVVVNDFAPSKLPQRKPLPGDEIITFNDLPSGDSDKEHLDKIKDEMLEEEAQQGESKITMKEHKKRLKEKQKEWRDGLIHDIYENTSASQSEISNMDFVGVSQPQVNRILKTA